MALADEYQGRYSTQRRTEISNPQDSTATTPNTTRENYAITDVQAAFKMRGITYDNTIDTHVTTAVGGVEARLLKVTGQPGGHESWKEWLDEVKLLSETTSRDRIVPSTDSQLSPTADTLGDIPVSDRKNFKEYVSDAPEGGTTMD
jgi:hypothetical protein